MNGTLFNGFVTRVSEAVFRNVRAFFLPDYGTSIPAPGEHANSMTIMYEKEWELNQGYSDIAARDLKAILLWLFPESVWQKLIQMYNKAMIYYFTDEIVCLEDNDAGISKEYMHIANPITPKILRINTWGNFYHQYKTISLDEKWTAMVQRWMFLNRIKNLLRNVNFLYKKAIKSDPAIPLIYIRPALTRLYLKICTLIFPKRN